ncbi:MAG TPA: hypothetical protein VND93_20810 [Myxococcales bacterium]|nr:hypothetical protein [Myxococcales bacterium]
MAVDGVDSSPQVPPQPPPEAPEQAPEVQPQQPDQAPAQPAQPAAPQDTYEQPQPQGPVDLNGGNNQQPVNLDDYYANRGNQTNPTVDPSAASGAGGPSPTDPVNPTSPAAPAAGVQDADPAQRADPNKAGAVINAEPAKWPSVDDLHNAGISGVRVTMSQGEGGNYNAGNAQQWKDNLSAYRTADPPIDVTLNMAPESAGKGHPAIPDILTEPNGMSGPNGTDPAHSVIPFTREGTRVDIDGEGNRVETKLSDDQAAAAKQWYQDFDQWKKDSYTPALQQAQRDLGNNVNRYEIWNEPDEPKNWYRPATATSKEDGYGPGIPPQAFGELMKTSYEALKPGVDPSSPEARNGPQIVSGGADSGQVSYLQRAQDATGGKLYADEVGVHPYLKRPTDSYGDAGEWTGTLQSISKDYSQLGKPLQFTEVGDKRPGNESYIPEAATSLSQPGMSNVQRGYYFWENPYDGDFGLNRRVVDNEATGQSHLDRQPSLNELTRRTHIPPAQAPAQ